MAKGGKGKLIFLKRETLESVRDLDMESTVVKVVWHSKINQVSGITTIIHHNLTHLDTDYHRNGKWSNLCAAFTINIHQWCQIVGKEGASA